MVLGADDFSEKTDSIDHTSESKTPKLAPLMDYVHPPLHDASKQIRLIKILPSEHTEILVCSMRVYNLRAVSGYYTAISYTWGPDIKDHSITLDGFRYAVRHNCWYALKQMQHRCQESGRPSGLFWIDALCIDQGTHGEKNMQVAQMGLIFAQAFEVVASMGDADTLHSHMEPCLDTSDAASKVDVATMAIELSRQPYFERVWTVQECILARRLRVAVCLSCWSWNTIMRTLDHVLNVNDWDTPSPYYTDLDGMPRDLYRLANLKRDIALYEKRSLVYLVVKYGQRYCTDLRDKIYGLLPLANVADREQLTIDYELSLYSLLEQYEDLCSKSRSTADDGWTSVALPPTVQRDSIHVLAQAFSNDETFTKDFMKTVCHFPSTETSEPKILAPKMWKTYRIDTDKGDSLVPMDDFTWQIQQTALAAEMLNTHETPRPLVLHCATLGQDPDTVLFMVSGYTRSGDFLFCPESGEDDHDQGAECPDVLMLTAREDQARTMAITGFARVCPRDTIWRSVPTSGLSHSTLWSPALECSVWLLAREKHATKWLYAVGLECLHGPLTTWTDGVRDGPSYISYKVSSIKPSIDIDVTSGAYICQNCGQHTGHKRLFDSYLNGQLERSLNQFEACAIYHSGVSMMKNAAAGANTIARDSDDLETRSLSLAQIHELRRAMYLVADAEAGLDAAKAGIPEEAIPTKRSRCSAKLDVLEAPTWLYSLCASCAEFEASKSDAESQENVSEKAVSEQCDTSMSLSRPASPHEVDESTEVAVRRW